jgi:hypothetical protein
MTFDDVRLFRITDKTFILNRAAAVMAAPESTAEPRTQLGVNIHFLKDDRALDLARGAGLSFVRMDLPWPQLERQGRYDFAQFECLMNSLETRSMGVLWVLDYGHHEHGGGSLRSKDDVAEYSRYAAAVVSHFRGHKARFEIWNEPNRAQFLANPAIYPDLLRAALEAIRRQDPGAAVSVFGMRRIPGHIPSRATNRSSNFHYRMPATEM